MYEQIYERKSIRKYKADGIPQEAAQALASWREWVTPLQDRFVIDNHIRRLPGDAHINGMFLIKAPAYMLYTSQQAPLAQVNAGFILEQVSLGLGTLGVGTCFLGGAHPAKEHLKALRFDPVIMMAYGLPDEPLTRTADGFKRKRMDQICSGDMTDDIRQVMECARLAPSAMNRQPWRFVVQGDTIHCCVVHGIGPMRPLSEIDLGIAMSHIYLAVTDRGGKVNFNHHIQGVDLAPHGAEYITTAFIQ